MFQEVFEVTLSRGEKIRLNYYSACPNCGEPFAACSDWEHYVFCPYCGCMVHRGVRR